MANRKQRATWRLYLFWFCKPSCLLSSILKHNRVVIYSFFFQQKAFLSWFINAMQTKPIKSQAELKLTRIIVYQSYGKALVFIEFWITKLIRCRRADLHSATEFVHSLCKIEDDNPFQQISMIVLICCDKGDISKLKEKKQFPLKTKTRWTWIKIIWVWQT